jgi:plastocyanin
MTLRRPPTIALLSLAAAGVLLGGCEQRSQGAGNPPTPIDGPRVGVIGNDFAPASLEVTAGETVTWVWEGSARHDVVCDDFRSEVQRAGTYRHTFVGEGAHYYASTLHPEMKGTVVVSAP